jgi:lysophospholipase L1-like esterase
VSRHFKVVAIIALIVPLIGCNGSKKEKYIVTIGDSNGASKTGWVVQLKKIRPQDIILNYSVSGNTVGFDNLDQERLNTLKNIDNYLLKAFDSTKTVDAVILLLGTNDAKAVFDSLQNEVPKNMELLISQIRKSFKDFDKGEPSIILVSPPPYGPDSILAEKYKGGNKRVSIIAKSYEILADKNGVKYVNVYDELNKNFMYYSKDGVHLNEEGQNIMASKIDSILNLVLDR